MNFAERLDQPWHNRVWEPFCLHHFYGPLKQPMDTVWGAHDVSFTLDRVLTQQYGRPRRVRS